MAKEKKTLEHKPDAEQAQEIKQEIEKSPKMVQIPEDQLTQIMDKLKMLEAVADKGRVFNYEQNRPQKKAMKIRLGVFKGGHIIRWRTVEDQLVQHPTTGEIIGEKQEYEVEVLGEAGELKVYKLGSYKQFSDARYDKRDEADVVGKKEDWDGNITYSVRLNDGRVIEIDSKFIN